MKKPRLMIVHAPTVTPEVIVAPDKNCLNDYMYLVPDNSNFVQFISGRYELEKDRNEWIRRYDNLLKGLNYWKNKALEK